MENIIRMKKNGFAPDICVAHSGWSCAFFVKDVFPRTQVIQYMEWWFDPKMVNKIYTEHATSHLRTLNTKQRTEMYTRNIPLAAELSIADKIVAPCKWQVESLPSIFKKEVVIQHEGINDDFYRINESWKVKGEELILFATRGLEPIRGFPDFIQSIDKLHKLRPNAKIVIVGDNKCYYAKSEIYKHKAREWATSIIKESGIPKNYVKFMPLVDKVTYARLLKRATLFMYLSRSFVPSWGLFNAICSGTRIISVKSMMMESILQETGVEVTLCENLEALTIAQTIHEELKRKTDIEIAIRNRNRVVNNMGHRIAFKNYQTLLRS